MNLWETTLVSLQKGYDRLTLFAATFSDRVKAEINIVRLRMQVDEMQSSIRSEHEAIGRKLVEMRDEGTLPRTFDMFFKNDEISASLDKIELAESTLDDLADDLDSESRSILQEGPNKEEEASA